MEGSLIKMFRKDVAYDLSFNLLKVTRKWQTSCFVKTVKLTA